MRLSTTKLGALIPGNTALVGLYRTAPRKYAGWVRHELQLALAKTQVVLVYGLQERRLNAADTKAYRHRLRDLRRALKVLRALTSDAKPESMCRSAGSRHDELDGVRTCNVPAAVATALVAKGRRAGLAAARNGLVSIGESQAALARSETKDKSCLETLSAWAVGECLDVQEAHVKAIAEKQMNVRL